MPKKHCVVAILGYGCHLTPTTDKYLSKAALFAKHNHVTTIIVSGGYTNKTSAPEVSEAAMMAEELRNYPCLEDCIIIEDKEPIDTRGNLRGIEQIRKEKQLEHLPLVIFCDTVHAPKIRLFSLLLHRSLPRIETYSLTHGFIPKLKHLFVVTVLEMVALVIPYMEKKRFERRKRIVENS